MRTVSAILSVAVLALLLTWLSLRAADTNAELFDKALGELDQYTNVQAALHRDVLAARAGLLRNYDPLVHEVNAIYASLQRLRDIATVEPRLLAPLDQLNEVAGRQEQTVEQVKSDNALLHNSLTHFARIGRGLAPGRTQAPVPEASALVADMLHLTLNASPEVVREVRDRIESLSAAAFADEDTAQALLAHGRLLLGLLPQMDAELKALAAVADVQSRDGLRAVILKHQKASRTTARHYRLVLCATSLLLVGVLICLALRLRARAIAIRRRGALERAVTRISTRFIAAAPRDTDAGIDQALAELAQCVGADRAYFLLRGDHPRTHLWCRQGISGPPGWPEHAPDLSVDLAPTGGRTIQVVDVRRLRPAARKQACLAAGLRGWALASGRSSQGRVFLGFDAVAHPSSITHPGELGVLPMALDLLVNAIERQATESEKARLENRLQQTRRMETVGALASGIAHNFNNIIGAILGYVEMAEAQIAPDSRTAQHLSEIRRAGERGRDVVDQLLRFGRRSSGRRRPTDVGNLMAESESLLQASLPREIDLAFHKVPGAARVVAEPAQLQQVVLNLCSNAAQAMDGKGRIEVEATVHEIVEARELTHGALAPGHHVLIAVTDSGHGMDRSVLETLFEPFFTTRTAGNGLGLATVREIMREHGGAINVISNPGKGSRFEVWLACISHERAGHKESSTMSLGCGETILLLGHTREQLLRDEEILAALGYEPVGFLRADDAVTACRSTPERFDAILIGHMSSCTQTICLPAELHAITPRLPIFVAAEASEAFDVDALVAAGVSEVVSRPIVADEIAAALARCLGTERSCPATTYPTEVEISA
jgi:signal transduction histidine kinase